MCLGSSLHQRTLQGLLNVTVDEAIERDPETGELRAASHNRNNSAGVAW